ncbi:MAG: hypothetical protein V4760_15555 [Bdellovibrionota bacterium]
MKAFILTAAILVTAGFAQAHEGHDHDAPSMVQAPKGGMIKSNETLHIEVVPKGKDLKIFVYSKDLKPAEVAKIAVTAQTELPRTKKVEPLALQPKGDHFEASFDAKGAHRYTLILTVGEHKDRITFTIEPRK